jgi:hypothetical protein
MNLFFVVAAALLQGGATALMYYMGGEGHMWPQDEFVTFFIPAVVGFGLFFRGFAALLSAGSADYRNPIAFGAAFVSALLVMVATIGACVRYLGS